ncbi:MAG: metalloendopeptidase, partial [Lentisphaerae bacterium]|nr:metalloendopeptidase [Lentisphaerota bacterium]
MQQTTPLPGHRPHLRTTVDLNLGDAGEVTLSDGSVALVRLLGMESQTDSLRGAVRRARVDVQVNGETASLISAAYHLPITVGGVQIDCPVVAPLLRKRWTDEPWSLEHDVRLRFWPANSPWITPGTFRYPAVQRWFATDTQMCNEPCFVGGAEYVGTERVYYHDGLDIGGSEGDTEVIASGDGIVVCAGDDFD